MCTSATATLAENMVAVINDPEGVNLRGGPGTNYASLAVIPKGSEAPVLGPRVNDNWLPVLYQGTMGFVHDEFVEVKTVMAQSTPSASASASTTSTTATPTPSPSPQPAGAAQAGQTAQEMRVDSADGLNLRAGPSIDQRVLTVVPNGTLVKVISRSPDGRWANITYNGQTGWVNTEFLEKPDARPSPTPATNPGSAAGSARFIWPVAGRSITTTFGGGHEGIDIDQYPSGGNPVVAVAAGTVTFAGGNPCCSYGYYIKIQHEDGSESLYAHLGSIETREGQKVAQGDTIARSGNTGRSTGAHVHLELRMRGALADPLSMLPR